MKFHPYFSKISYFNMLQSWVAIQCFAYYVYDYPVVTDERYDHNARQLKRLMKKYPDLHKESKYYEAFKDFDPSTGFDLLEKIRICYPAQYLVLMDQASHLVFA